MTKLRHPLRRTRFVELPADLRHAVRDGDDRAQRRHGSWAAQEFDKAAAKPGKHGSDVVICRIEGKHRFRLRPALLMSNGLEQMFLAVEIDVKRPFGHPGLASDLAHASGIEA